MKKAKTAYARQLQEIDKRLEAIFDFIKTLTTNNDQKNDLRTNKRGRRVFRARPARL